MQIPWILFLINTDRINLLSFSHHDLIFLVGGGELRGWGAGGGGAIINAAEASSPERRFSRQPSFDLLPRCHTTQLLRVGVLGSRRRINVYELPPRVRVAPSTEDSVPGGSFAAGLQQSGAGLPEAFRAPDAPAAAIAADRERPLAGAELDQPVTSALFSVRRQCIFKPRAGLTFSVLG
jgi:hypothetical protein